MELFTSLGMEGGALRSLSRCRGAKKVIFLSDMATADGKYLEAFVFELGNAGVHFKYNFP
jgi:hypothetical protein